MAYKGIYNPTQTKAQQERGFSFLTQQNPDIEATMLYEG